MRVFLLLLFLLIVSTLHAANLDQNSIIGTNGIKVTVTGTGNATKLFVGRSNPIPPPEELLSGNGTPNVMAMWTQTNALGDAHDAYATNITFKTRFLSDGSLSFGESSPSLVLGTNAIAVAGRSSLRLISPTNDASQVLVKLTAPITPGEQILFLQNYSTNTSAWTLKNGQALAGGGTTILNGDFVGSTSGQGILLKWNALNNGSWEEVQRFSPNTNGTISDVLWQLNAGILSPIGPTAGVLTTNLENFGYAYFFNAVVEVANKQIVTTGTNLIDMLNSSHIKVLSDTNAVSGVILQLTGGTNTGHRASIVNASTNSGFTLPNGSTNTAGGHVYLNGQRDWVTSNNFDAIQLLYEFPDWIELGRSSPTNGDTGSIVINPTDNYMPYRSSFDTFGNSPWERTGAKTLTAHLDTSGQILYQLDNSIALMQDKLFAVQPNSTGQADPNNGATGVSVVTAAAATAAIQQWSPGVSWRARGWSTNNAESEDVLFQSFVASHAGSTNPYGSLIIESITHTNSAVTNFSVSSASGYTGSGTNYLSDDGTYKTVTTTTINSTDGFLPVRGSSSTFSNSVLEMIGGSLYVTNLTGGAVGDVVNFQNTLGTLNIGVNSSGNGTSTASANYALSALTGVMSIYSAGSTWTFNTSTLQPDTSNTFSIGTVQAPFFEVDVGRVKFLDGTIQTTASSPGSYQPSSSTLTNLSLTGALTNITSGNASFTSLLKQTNQPVVKTISAGSANLSVTDNTTNIALDVVSVPGGIFTNSTTGGTIMVSGSSTQSTNSPLTVVSSSSLKSTAHLDMNGNSITNASFTTAASGTFTGNGAGITNVPQAPAIFAASVTAQSVTTTGKISGLNGSFVTGILYAYSVLNDNIVGTPLVRPMTFTNLVIKARQNSSGGAFGTGTNFTFIVYTNTVASGLLATLTTDGTTTVANSGTTSVKVPANASVSIRMTNIVSAASADIGWSLEAF